MIIELHLLQSFPVSNLNRDDIGQPKTVTFGGHTRGRISSQCLKRSARQLFNRYGLDTAETGLRTKRLLSDTTRILTANGHDSTAAESAAREALHALGFGVDDATGLTQYLLFVGRQASRTLADYCTRNWDSLTNAADAAASKRKKPAKANAQTDAATAAASEPRKKVKPDKATLAEAARILDATKAADVALFGRMIADNKDFSVDAASQVAHAISTHAIVNEFDYYTAVDDLKPSDSSGADMIGTVDFNAACYYRYANVDLNQLTKNLDGDNDLAQRTTRAWLHAFINAVPSGKQNSTAARTMPETLLTVVRDHGAWNLANAFLTPVAGADHMTASTERLLSHFTQLRGFYGSDSLHRVTAATVTGQPAGMPADEVVTTLDDLVTRTLTATTT